MLLLNYKKEEVKMITIDIEALERLEFILVKHRGENEVWAFDNQRIVRDPKTEEIIDNYFLQEKEKTTQKNTIKL